MLVYGRLFDIVWARRQTASDDAERGLIRTIVKKATARTPWLILADRLEELGREDEGTCIHRIFDLPVKVMVEKKLDPDAMWMPPRI
jgi:hypothetical protein